ncbi:DUF805 domain-containing protein [Tenacibaculum amylolyticum]|uniref:DUF805 domain-containing protein n=1 Tax=Tenacibaculum amylolyticum TaxID=104269 RepID=UPI0038942907
MNWYVKVLKEYATFEGRARREEYWMFILFQIIFLIAASILDVIIGTPGVFYFIYFVATIIPSLAVAVRRLHDVGRSGWYYFIGAIPLVGPILLLVWFCTDSDYGPNKWGENPKGLGNKSEIESIGTE